MSRSEKNSSMYDETYKNKLLEVFGSLADAESSEAESEEGSRAELEEDDNDVGVVDDPEEAALTLRKMKKYKTDRRSLDKLLQAGAADLKNVKAERAEKRKLEKHKDDMMAEAVAKFITDKHDSSMNDDDSAKSANSWEDEWVEGIS